LIGNRDPEGFEGLYPTTLPDHRQAGVGRAGTTIRDQAQWVR